MDSDDKAFLGFGCAAALGVAALNLVFWGGLIWLTLYLLNKYGVI